MQKIVNFLNKIEIWFFYGFLITFTLSIRKVLFFYPIKGQFNEYTGIYLYLSDIFILFLLASAGLTILYNNLSLKSRYRFDFKLYLKQKIIIIPLILVIFSFISVLWSANGPVSFYRSLKLLEFYLLYLWVISRLFGMFHPSQNVPRLSRSDKLFHVEQFIYYWDGTLIRNSFSIFIGTGLVQSIIGIWQFIIQKSLGLFWLKESLISPNIPGVAKIILNGIRYIRSYGLFPHPNILGGFLVLSIILTILYFKQFHACPVATFCSTWNKKFATGMEQIKKELWRKFVYYAVLGSQTLALILTFSKSAWIGLIIALAFLCYQNVPRGTLLSFTTKKLKYFALFGGIVILLIVIAKPGWYSIIGKSIEDRMFYLNVSRGTFLEHPVLGVGMGQFLYQLGNVPGIQDWQFQPVHNVFLLILNELGVIGLLLFLWFVWEAIRNKEFHPGSKPIVPRLSRSDKLFHVEQFIYYWDGTFLGSNYFRAVFFGFIFIMLFDHYFWDIQQGQIMLWLILGLIIGWHAPTPKLKNENEVV